MQQTPTPNKQSRWFGSVMNESTENSVKLFMIGGVAGVVSRTAVSPLERIKIIFQTQNHNKKYGSITSALVEMYKEEGFKSYFKGNGINCIRMFPTNALQFYFYDFYKAMLPLKEGRKDLSPNQRFIAGSSAGITATIFTYPLDFLRAYLTVQKENKGIMEVSRMVYQKAGMLGFFKGLWPSILGVIPYTGFYFSMYDLMKKLVPKRDDGSISPLYTILNGGVAGAVAQTAAYPLDVVRRRMQLQLFAQEGDAVYSGTWDAFKRIKLEEGYIGYFRGWWPNFVKVVPALAISFLTYESLCEAMHVQTSKK